MKKKRKWLKWVIILVIIAALVGYVAIRMRNVSPTALYTEDEVSRGSISTYYSFSGDIDLAKQETHSAAAECEVREVYVSEGDQVKKDDRLARLSNGTTIKAGIPGEITVADVSKDDTVSAGTLMFEISDFSTMRVNFDVDEFDISAVNVGKDATVTIDALDYTFDSPITRISKTSRSSGDITYYTARVEPDLSALPDSVLPGMRVDVKVLGAYAEDTLMIKMDALQFDEYNMPYVLTYEGDAMQHTYVDTGINDGVYVEILSGLSEGDSVYYISADSTIASLMAMRSSAMSN